MVENAEMVNKKINTQKFQICDNTRNSVTIEVVKVNKEDKILSY